MKIKDLPRDRRGYALILVIALIAVGIFMVVAFLDVMVIETREGGIRRSATKAFWYAEAGLSKGQWYLITPPPLGKGSDYDTSKEKGGKLTEDFDEGKYEIKIEKSGKERTITSWGTFRDVTRQIQQKFRVVAGTFDFLVFGSGNTISLKPFCGSEDNNAHCCRLVLTDSYDSRLGDYDASKAGSNGDIGTNSTAKKAITLDTTDNEETGPNAKTPKVRINGDVFVGPGANVSKAVFTAGNVTISGTKAALSQAKPMPPIEVPPGLEESDDIEVDDGETVTMAGGTYLVEDVDVEEDGVLKFSGPAEIYIEDDLEIDKGGRIEAFEKKPHKLILYFMDDDDVTLGDLYAALYAPDSKVTLRNNTDIYGAVVSKSVRYRGKRGKVELHYDEALRDAV